MNIKNECACFGDRCERHSMLQFDKLESELVVLRAENEDLLVDKLLLSRDNEIYLKELEALKLENERLKESVDEVDSRRKIALRCNEVIEKALKLENKRLMEMIVTGSHLVPTTISMDTQLKLTNEHFQIENQRLKNLIERAKKFKYPCTDKDCNCAWCIWIKDAEEGVK